MGKRLRAFHFAIHIQEGKPAYTVDGQKNNWNFQADLALSSVVQEAVNSLISSSY